MIFIEKLFIRILLVFSNFFLRFLPSGNIVIEGKTLHPKIQFGLVLSKLKPALDSLSPVKSRIQYKKMIRIFDLKKTALPKIENLFVLNQDHQIPIRIYYPMKTSEPLPCLLYFHGGGFVIGDLETVDSPVRYLCKQSGCIIISVDYRLSPENKFPVAFEDSFAAYQWVVANGKKYSIDTNKIGVAGDSAGGCIATGLCQMAYERYFSPIPSFQVLIYPCLDLCSESETYQVYPNFTLTVELMRYFRNHFFTNRPKESVNPSYFPFFAKDLKNQPAAFVQLSGFDPLLQEERDYIQKLQNAGVDVEFIEYKSLTHGYISMAGILSEAKQALDGVAEYIKKRQGYN
ncbi:MAG: alpha/beta hydrolase [Leptospiraceae bacterium]|nr:alpha/beta hydrolase [Leptospiraceae bacterium]